MVSQEIIFASFSDPDNIVHPSFRQGPLGFVSRVVRSSNVPGVRYYWCTDGYHTLPENLPMLLQRKEIHQLG